MFQLVKKVQKRVNSFIFALVFNGLVLFMLGVLVLAYPLVLQVIVAIFVFFVAYAVLHAAYHLNKIKKEIEKHFNL